jgi:hypothetical protein
MNRIPSKVREDGGDGAFYNLDVACITMSSAGYRTTGVISPMPSHIEPSPVQFACTSSSKFTPTFIHNMYSEI